MPIQPLVAQRLYQQAADQIRELIQRGEYAPGDRLPPERELAKRLGISRPTVREAMIVLEIAGVIAIRAGAGIYVSSAPARETPAQFPAADAGPSPFDLLDARRLLECELVERAARVATRSELASIRETIEEMERDMASGGDGRDADRRFHARIAEAARNSVLAGLVDGLWEGMSTPLFHHLSDHTGLPQNQQMTVRDHRAIYDCLRRRDAQAARAAMAAHLSHVEAILAGADDLARSASKRRRARRLARPCEPKAKRSGSSASS
ncbi:MAG TPA: FadR/GntR family transcriptional regulator [Alphaproteobacteria bacterium]|nr:FadR/GntR family transcriptional regulator [Alphaproteobacteria bacterium]